ncbi:MAG: hypothetical protein NT069_14660 [Planctomycetota bacterium]|nr:hypothetical protein [Planctomycetota bacterium]
MHLAPDFSLPDLTQPIRLVVTRSDGRQEITLNQALPRPSRRSETDRGAVVLLDERIDWLLPADALPTGVEPQPADEIVAGGVVWTIVSIERRVAGTVWRCTCRRRE